PPSLPSTLFPYTTLFRSTRGKWAGDFTPSSRQKTRRILKSGIAPHFAVWCPVMAGGWTCSLSARVCGASTNLRRSQEKAAHSRRSEEHTSELQSPYDLVC